MGENGGRTTGQLLSHGPCACLAWCLMSLAHIQCVGTAGLAVSDDGNGRCRKTLEFQGKYFNPFQRRTQNATVWLRITKCTAMTHYDRSKTRLHGEK